MLFTIIKTTMTAPILHAQLESITAEIWQKVLGQEVAIIPTVVDCDEEQYVGSICLSGAWNGRLEIMVSACLARNIAEYIFDGSDAPVSLYEIEESLKEIVNMTGGGLKNFLPEPTILSLPAFSIADKGHDTFHSLTTFTFAIYNEPYTVTLMINEELF